MKNILNNKGNNFRYKKKKNSIFILDLDFVQNEINDKNYQIIYKNFENTTLYQKLIPGFQGSAQKRWMFTGTFPYSTDTVFITLSNNDYRKNWDTNQVFYKVIEVLKDELESNN